MEEAKQTLEEIKLLATMLNYKIFNRETDRNIGILIHSKGKVITNVMYDKIKNEIYLTKNGEYFHASSFEEIKVMVSKLL